MLRGVGLFPVYCILSAVLLTSCGAKDPIYLGFIATLSGRNSIIGLEERNSVVMAVEELNESGGIGGRLVEVEYADDMNDPEEARRVMKMFIDARKDAVIGHTTSTMTLASYDLAVEAGMVVVSASATTPRLSRKDDIFYRVTSSADRNAEALAVFLREEEKLEKPVVIRDTNNDAFTGDWTQAFIDTVGRLGGDPFKPVEFSGGGSEDFAGIIRDVLEMSPDSIVIVASAIDTALISQQVRKYDMRIPLYASFWAMTDELIFNGGSSVEGLLLPWANRMGKGHAWTDDFTDSYALRFGFEPQFMGRQAYEAVQYLAEGFRRLEGGDFSDLRSAMSSIRRLEGINDSLEFDEYGDALRTEYIYEVRDGRFRYAEE